MTDTVISSATKEVVIGFGRPFVMIGERINPTGRKLLAEEMKNGDFSRVEADALAQVAAGAQMLDVNAGIPLADEPALLAQAIKLVQSVTDVPLSIDSSIIEALEAGIEAYQGKPLINSVTGENEVMERVLPIVAKAGAAVVAVLPLPLLLLLPMPCPPPLPIACMRGAEGRRPRLSKATRA